MKYQWYVILWVIYIYISIPTGAILPLTVTVSICLRCSLHLSVRIYLSIPLIRIEHPNCLVAASNLEDMLTLGDR